MRTDLTLGLPNGSLQNPTFELLHRIGVDVKLRGRNSEAVLEGVELFKQVVLMRPHDLPIALMQGKVDCAICGLDWVTEQELDPLHQNGNAWPIISVQTLNYARSTRQPVRVSIFGRPDSPPLGQPGRPVQISSEYPNITRKHYPQEEVFFSHGTTEVKVAMGLFDYGVCIIETGSSIRAHGLEIVDTLLISPTVLIAREDRQEIRYFGQLLQGALEAEQYKLMKMNIIRDKKDTLIDMLPSLDAPTVSLLANDSYAVETVVPKDKITDLVIQIKSIGGTGILVQDLDVILG